MVKEPLNEEEMTVFMELLQRFIRDAAAQELERQLLELKFSLYDKIDEMAERQNPVYYTRDEVCGRLGICRATFHNWADSRILKTRKVGNRVYVAASDLDKVMSRIQKGELCAIRKRKTEK